LIDGGITNDGLPHYCLGVSLRELLRSVHELERAVLEEEPTMPSEVVGRDPRSVEPKGDLDAIVLKSMQKSPSRRYASGGRTRGRRQAVPRRRTDHSSSLDVGVSRSSLGASASNATEKSLGAGIATATLVVGFTLRDRMAGDRLLQRVRLADPEHLTDDEGLELDPAMSPDGKQVAYTAGPGSAVRIFIRRQGEHQSRMLTGSLEGNHRRPRWSPDGARLLFEAEGAIWMIPASGGPPSLVVAAPADTIHDHRRRSLRNVVAGRKRARRRRLRHRVCENTHRRIATRPHDDEHRALARVVAGWPMDRGSLGQRRIRVLVVGQHRPARALIILR